MTVSNQPAHAWTAEEREAAHGMILAGEQLWDISLETGIPYATLETWRRALLLPETPGPACLGLSPHVTPARASTRVLAWRAPVEEGGRVLAYTCCCVPASYELVSYRGRFRIRRHTTARRQAPETMVTAESWIRADANRIWEDLLTGGVR